MGLLPRRTLRAPAGSVSEHVSCVVNFYGRQRFARRQASRFLPIELTGLIEYPTSATSPEFDDLIPLADVEELRAALAERGVPHQVHVYEGAKHGFSIPPVPPSTIRAPRLGVGAEPRFSSGRLAARA